jgi:hypothetical protein
MMRIRIIEATEGVRGWGKGEEVREGGEIDAIDAFVGCIYIGARIIG